MKPIYIDKNTRGVLVHAVPKDPNKREWLVLIHSINNSMCIRRHISFCPLTKECYISTHQGDWGLVHGYDFYEPTEDDLKTIKNIMKQKGYRFIKILNKLKKVYV